MRIKHLTYINTPQVRCIVQCHTFQLDHRFIKYFVYYYFVKNINKLLFRYHKEKDNCFFKLFLDEMSNNSMKFVRYCQTR